MATTERDQRVEIWLKNMLAQPSTAPTQTTTITPKKEQRVDLDARQERRRSLAL